MSNYLHANLCHRGMFNQVLPVVLELAVSRGSGVESAWLYFKIPVQPWGF